MNRFALVHSATGFVTNVILWDGNLETWAPDDGYEAILSEYAQIGWSYVNGLFAAPPYVPPILTPAEIEAQNRSTLQQSTQLAAAQKTALTNRVGTLQDAIELDEATPAEIAELPVRQAQLLEWKRYAIYLGRVTLQEGWALTVEWPVRPTEGMDLTVSAVAPAPVQAS